MRRKTGEGGTGELGLWLGRYLAHLEAREYSPETLRSRGWHLGRFVAWCEERGVARPEEVDRGLVEQYQWHLFHHRKENGEPLSVGSQIHRASQVRHWFGWMTRVGKLKGNPASELELPREEQRLPKGVLSEAEAEAVLAVPDTGTPLGLRDRAMLETLYSTGLRRSELVGLRLQDVDGERGTLRVRGKGKKERVVPIGGRALAWVEKYLDEARALLMEGSAEEEALFVTRRGTPLKAMTLTMMASACVKTAGFGGRGSVHLFRHTAATLMLEDGADIRFIQEMLGHEVLSTTQVYARVSIRKLKEVHTQTHPGRLAQAGEGAKGEGDGEG